MISERFSGNIYLAVGSTDMRKAINGLCILVEQVAENAIRPFVVGRKNWLFAGHPNGANASATFFSLIETAKANALEPFAYLCCLFEQLPFVKEQSEYRQLLSQYIDPKFINLSA